MMVIQNHARTTAMDNTLTNRPSEKPSDILIGMPATSEYVKMICDSAANVQTIADILAIFTVRVYARCSWASSRVFLPRLGILLHRGKRMSPYMQVPTLTEQS